MATYSDSMAGYADFRSVGRYFALAAVASSLIGVAAVYAGSGRLGVLAIWAARPPFSLQRIGLGGLALAGIARAFLAIQSYANRFDGGLKGSDAGWE